MNANRLAALLLALGIAPLSGCSGEKFAEVTGTVTLKNKPLASGVVTFFPETGSPVAAFVKDGTYTFPSLVYGNYRIAVTPTFESPDVVAGGSGQPRKPGQVDQTGRVAAAPKKESGPSIPEKYRLADTSGLSWKVAEPKVTCPIALD